MVNDESHQQSLVEYIPIFQETENENEYQCSYCGIHFLDENDPIFCHNVNCLYNVMGIDGLVKCLNCGNVWDGYAQCNCWEYGNYCVEVIGQNSQDTEILSQDTEILSQDTEILSQDTEILSQDTPPSFNEIENSIDNLEFNMNQIKPPELIRQNAFIINR